MKLSGMLTDVQEGEGFIADEDEEEADFPIEDIHEISTDKPLRYETVVYPTFARCLRMKVVTCTEDCCVRVSSI